MSVSARLAACVRATDTVARLGGDEFAVILENLPVGDESEAHEGAQNVADKMIASLVFAPHPEASHFRETFRDASTDGARAASTAIYFLLREGEVSAQPLCVVSGLQRRSAVHCRINYSRLLAGRHSEMRVVVGTRTRPRREAA